MQFQLLIKTENHKKQLRWSFFFSEIQTKLNDWYNIFVYAVLNVISVFLYKNYERQRKIVQKSQV